MPQNQRVTGFGFAVALVALFPHSGVAGSDLLTHSISRAAVSVPGESADLRQLKAAAEAYRRNQPDVGDQAAGQIKAPDLRRAAEWAALRLLPSRPGVERIAQFLASHPDFPMRGWLQRRAEEGLFLERAVNDRARAYFASHPPVSAPGKALQALLLAQENRHQDALALARTVYLDRSSNRDVATLLEKHFPALAAADLRERRAHRLILADRYAEGLRLAAELGPDRLKLAQALAHAANDGKASAQIDAVPKELRAHPSYKLAAAQILRRQDKWQAARDMMLSVPAHEAAALDGDAFWSERRLLARRLLNMGDFAGAYRVVAEHGGSSQGHRAEAEFHAGWIALRYLAYPQTASFHFKASADVAVSPLARSRAAYWQGRAIDAGARGSAEPYYQQAAALSTTYYGQLAAERLKQPLALDTRMSPSATGRDGAVSLALSSALSGTIEGLTAAGLAELAVPLVVDHAREGGSDTGILAHVDHFERLGDASTVLAIGKAALERDRPFVRAAFPVFGVPSFDPIVGSAELPLVFAIARQESAFRARAVSHANAKGLMQMLPSTAARTARRFNVAFEPGRLTTDPAFNARLGAAHLGELLEETQGSLVMAIASYNAGGARVREWVQTFGDPRDPATDVIDWIERIPFYETRHYVQKVLENLQVYRARFGEDTARLRLSDDFRTGHRVGLRGSLRLADER